MLQKRVNAGLARAKAEGIQLGRPAEVAGDAAKVKAIRAAKAPAKAFAKSRPSSASASARCRG